MRFLFLVCSVVLIPGCLQQETSPIEIHQLDISPEAPEASVKNGSPQKRNQRNVFALKAGNSFGLKQTALNLIFGSVRGTRPPPAATTTEKVPQFARGPVTLDLSGDLLQLGNWITGNISTVIGSVFLNTVGRAQQLLEVAKPLVAAKLGLDISPSSFTTPEPIESLVPRLGPPLGGQPNNSSDAASIGGVDATPPTPGGLSANRVDRSARGPS